ncbi:MAG: class I SAM-dependent methyltransferase [Pseudomonadales bacterium]
MTPSTESKDYSTRLEVIQDKPWKKMLGALNPYRVHIRRVLNAPGLEVGCGIGRVLGFAANDILGVDHNAHSIEICRNRGLHAMTSDEFFADKSSHIDRYQTLIFSHVLEHMTATQAKELVSMYMPFVKPGGKLVLICPQEKGYASDETHIEFLDEASLVGIAEAAGFKCQSRYSYPFPRAFGKWFIYNESVVIAVKAVVE